MLIGIPVQHAANGLREKNLRAARSRGLKPKPPFFHARPGHRGKTYLYPDPAEQDTHDGRRPGHIPIGTPEHRAELDGGRVVKTPA